MAEVLVNNKPIRVIRPINESLKNVSESYGEISPSENFDSVNGIVEKDKLSKLTHSWVRKGNDFFASAKPNAETVPAGLYDINQSQTVGLFLTLRGITVDEIYLPPSLNMNIVLNDLIKFWSLEERYAEYGIIYKRGVLLYGQPGTGKSSLVNLILKEVITKHDGIVINAQDLYTLVPMLHTLRSLEPTKKILVLFEDFDSLVYNSSSTQLLNLMDGNNQIDNVVYLATTNYIDRLEDRYLRPSRLDLLVHIDMPTPEDRMEFFNRKLKDEDKANITPAELQRWVNDTDGFSYAHLKEFIISVVVMGNDYSQTVARLTQIKNVSDK